MYFTQDKVKYTDNLDGTYTLDDYLCLITGNYERIIVPKGYTCNASSIPRFFWRVCGAPNHPENIRAGFVHDYLYSTRKFKRKECDRIFRDALVIEGKPKPIAYGMYYAVRVGGKPHY